MAKSEERLEKIIDFMKECEKFKLIERKILVSSRKRYENDAEHSWHLALFILLLEHDIPKSLDMLRMVKLALIHDLGEIYVGDVSFFDTKGRHGKEKRELASARRLFARLPKNLQKEMLSLFVEYSEAKTPEAKFVKALDKLQATVQTICSKGSNMRKLGLSYSAVDTKKRPYMTHNKKLLTLYEMAMAEAKKKKLFAEED